MKVLVVEDDESILEPLVHGLEREGFEIVAARNGSEALDGWHDVDLVLLDLGLPDLDGQAVCREMRARSPVPIIVVTARADEVDRVLLLEMGADDYVVKPFGFRELVARIRAVSRRTAHAEPEPSLVVGALTIDRRTRRVELGGRPVDLTPKEFDLLAFLARDPGAVHERDVIIREVWDEHWWGPTKTLDVHVASLRKKLGDPAWIRTVRGVGYTLESAA